uniref:Uncharacterized protein n=1 Tax=Meloidogyne hapla TaxID=6305 RepID=A0A1I8BHG5_MELHA
MPTSSVENRRILLVDRQQRAFIKSNAHAHLDSPSPQYNSQYLPPSDIQDLKGGERLGNGFYSPKLHRRLADSVQSIDEHRPPSKSRKFIRQNRSSLPPRFCSSASITPLAVKSNRIGRNYIESPTSTSDLFPIWMRHTSAEKILKDFKLKKNVQTSETFSNNDCDYSPLQHQEPFVDIATESLVLSFGIPALPVKHARRTSITEYNNGICNNDRPKTLSTKCVNFAPMLATLARNEEENKNNVNNTETVHEKQDKNLSRNCYNTAIISPHGRNLGQSTPNSTPRNPHVVYARTDRQPINLDFGVENQRMGEEMIDNDRSLSKAHIEMEEHRQQPKMAAHVVRPIAAIKAANASPSAFRNISSNQPKTSPLMNRGVPTGNVPIGRATAQPRVNITNHIETSASPYSSIRVQREGELENNTSTNVQQQRQPPCNNKSVGSAEELSVQEIDQMIDTLQQLQHEFTQAEGD